jgi:GINS complex subunit 1
MLGARSKKLVKELKTSQWLPPYNESLINSIVEDINTKFEELGGLLSMGRDEDGSLIITTHNSLIRDKRAVLCYLNYRLNKLEQLKWETGSLPMHFMNNLSRDEIEYFKQYSTLLHSYSREVSNSKLDLTADLQPPKDVYVEVRCREEQGDVVLLESGTVGLHRNSMYLLKRSEADQYIRQGVLEQIN